MGLLNNAYCPVLIEFNYSSIIVGQAASPEDNEIQAKDGRKDFDGGVVNVLQLLLSLHVGVVHVAVRVGPVQF